jgi:Endonuclease NucS
MGAEVHLWQVDSEQLSEIVPARLDLESRLQEWLARDISILDPALLVIGREVPTDFGGFIDILCVDAEGDLVIVELKRNRTPREVTAQALDYASWVTSLSNDRVSAIAGEYPNITEDFESAFRAKFGVELPETLNEDHRILVVGSEIDSSSERIISYLSREHGVNINAATFQYYLQPNGPELLARVFLLDPSEVELKTRTQGASKRRPNLTDEELRASADEAGVAELYNYAFDAFQAVLYIQRKRASIAFQGKLDRGRRVVINLVPGDSSSEDGLRFQVYKTWYAERAGIPPATSSS